MKIIISLLFAIVMLTACNSNSDSKAVAKDSISENPSDSFDYNPATPAAQNSDEPERFSP
jgi:hypothetical protein